MDRPKAFSAKALPDGWTIAASLSAIALSVPLGYVLFYLLKDAGPNWQHVSAQLLPGYLKNTLWIGLGVALFSLLFGVPSAWLVSAYDFPFRKHLGWALYVPLSLPAYISAYTYAYMFSYGGFFYKIFEQSTGSGTPFEIMSAGGAVFIMSSVLYPYVYIIAKNSFAKQSASLIEVSLLLGKSPSQTFFGIALPLARPAIFGGLFLVLMEVLNEYGTMKYYGVSTFTTGIFRSWFSLGEKESAMRLAAYLMLSVFALMFLERLQRGRLRFSDASKSSQSLARKPLRGLKAVLAFAACFFPVLFGFLIPVGQLLAWAIQTAHKTITPEFFTLAYNSFYLGFGGALLVLAFSVFLSYTARISPSKLMETNSKLAVLGYSIPGAVIAVGVLASFLALDKWLGRQIESFTGIDSGLLLSSSVAALFFAYLVRFLAVGYNGTESALQKIPTAIDEAAYLLGGGKAGNLFKIHLPILRPALFSAFIMVFVDVMKELPLTLILRPFNFDTLAIKAYQFASDEMVPESSAAALTVVFIGLVPTLLLYFIGEKTGGK